MISQNDVFTAVRRGYNDLEFSNNEDILAYFSDVDAESAVGHISNIKGILFEQEYVEQLALHGIEAQVFEATNHPVTDIMIIEDGEVINELQLKATDSVAYIEETMAATTDVEIVTTTEVAANIDNEMVFDSGISDSALEEGVAEELFSDSFNPLSPIGWLFGLF